MAGSATDERGRGIADRTDRSDPAIRTRYSALVEFSCEIFDDEGSPRRARRFVVASLDEIGFTGDVSLIELLASELVTNSIQHAFPPLFLRLHVSDRQIRVVVEDGDVENLPVRGVHDPLELAPSGRGLLLVDELADEWGCDVHRPDCKSVWFSVDTPAASQTNVPSPPPTGPT